ncbi:Uncharacterised protein [Escherichia coli]|nr:Uncharacterised protein [Escherichia coli]
MGTVTFDCRMFVSLYPEFSTVTPELLTAVFNQATALYLDNTDDSPVTDLKEREQLLFLLVAHLCALRGLGNGRDGQAGLVGVSPVRRKVLYRYRWIIAAVMMRRGGISRPLGC